METDLINFNLMNFLNLSSDCLLCGCNVPFGKDKSSSNQSNSTCLSNHKICTACHDRLLVSGQSCYVCGLPSTDLNIPCGECLKNSPPFDKSISAFHYQPPISEFITQYKYGGRLELLTLMTNYLVEAIEKKNVTGKNQLPDLLIPIPLHYKKRNKRGFNQSRLIANELSKVLNIPVSGNTITRIRETKTQASLDANQRKRNLKNAFAIKQTLPERIAIIDDIVTTATTVSELSALAQKHGAKYIEVWSLARAYSM